MSIATGNFDTFTMKEQVKIERIRRAYFSKLLKSKTSVDDLMPLFIKAKNIFDIIKRGPRRKKRK
jgi:hypothetical protein